MTGIARNIKFCKDCQRNGTNQPMIVWKMILVLLSLFPFHAFGQQNDLLNAVRNGEIDTIRTFIDSGGGVNREIESEGTLLQVALLSNQIEIIKYLIEVGADVNLTSEANDQPPLTLGITLDVPELLLFLIENGSNIDSEDNLGRTPLFKTLKPDRPNERTLLLENGADVNKQLENGNTVIVEAVSDANIPAVEQLISYNALIDGELVDKAACAQCHKIRLRPDHPDFVFLSGQNAEYTVKQLNDFYNGTRKNHRMDRLSRIFVKEINLALAEYYEGLPIYQNKITGTEALRANGKFLFTKICSSCHGLDGIETRNKLTPVLAGMNSSYVGNQLRAFKANERTNDAKSVMRNIAAELTKEQIFELSEFIQSM